jgi:hypothetical protein
MKQNITLAIEAKLLRKAKLLAARRGASLSRLLAEDLAGKVEEAEAYEQAKRQALSLFDKKLPLGGKGIGDRGLLHER